MKVLCMYLVADVSVLTPKTTEVETIFMARCSEVVTDFHEAWHERFTITGHPTLYLRIFIQ